MKNILFIILALFLRMAHADAPGFLLGVSTHAALGRNTPEEVEAASALGVNSVRGEFYWSSVQTKRGGFSPDRKALSSVDAFRRFNGKHRGCGMLILNYGHPDFVSSLPTSEREVDAFKRYALYAIEMMGPSICSVEVWNEWNIGAGRLGFKRRYGDPDDYANLVNAVAPAIRKLRPDLKIVVGSVADRDVKWLLQIIKKGVLVNADGVSVHPYNYAGRDPSAEELVDWTKKLADTLRREVGKDVPIYITEIGWPNHLGKGGHSEEQVAYYLARFFALIRTVPSVAGVWWYDLKDDGPSPFDKENNFGLYKFTGEAKPAAKAFSRVSEFVKGSNFRATTVAGVTVIRNPNESSYLLLGLKNGRTVSLRARSDSPIYWQDILAEKEAPAPAGLLRVEAGKAYLVRSDSSVSFKQER